MNMFHMFIIIVNLQRGIKMKHYTIRHGELKEIVDIDTICDSLRELVGSAEQRAQTAQEELKKLKDEKWKEKEIQILLDQLNKAKEDSYRGFPISKKEDEAIQNWKNQHYTNQHNADTVTKRIQLQGVSGGLFTYIFLPTSIGTSGVCRCNSCYRKALFDTGYIDEYKTSADYYKELERNISKYDAEFEFQEIG